MLSKIQLEFLWGIEISCQKSIRAAKYLEVVSHSNTNVWSFTQNCYGAVCIIHWCQVFGAYSEPTHYSKLFARGTVAQMSKEIVANRLRASIGMDKSQYRAFWKGVTAARNQFFVHYEFGTTITPQFPDTDHILRMCLEMRDIVREILGHESSSETEQLGDMQRFTSYYTNARYISEIQSGVRTLSHAVTSRQR